MRRTCSSLGLRTPPAADETSASTAANACVGEERSRARTVNGGRRPRTPRSRAARPRPRTHLALKRAAVEARGVRGRGRQRLLGRPGAHGPGRRVRDLRRALGARGRGHGVGAAHRDGRVDGVRRAPRHGRHRIRAAPRGLRPSVCAPEMRALARSRRSSGLGGGAGSCARACSSGRACSCGRRAQRCCAREAAAAARPVLPGPLSPPPRLETWRRRLGKDSLAPTASSHTRRASTLCARCRLLLGRLRRRASVQLRGGGGPRHGRGCTCAGTTGQGNSRMRACARRAGV